MNLRRWERGEVAILRVSRWGSSQIRGMCAVMVSVTSNRTATDSTHVPHASLTPLSAPTPCMQAGETALHTAARNDNSEAVELLLQHKASVDIQDRVIRGDALVVANMLVIRVRARLRNVSDWGRVRAMIGIRERCTGMVGEIKM